MNGLAHVTSHHAGPPRELFPALQQHLPGVAVVVDHHGVVRAEVEGEERPVANTHTHTHQGPEADRH